jgi:uncharacterized delta-60 repeat protein
MKNQLFITNLLLLQILFTTIVWSQPGTNDSSFDPGTGANNTVRTIAIQTDGKTIIAGDFTSFNGTSRNRIARLNVDGSLDADFDPGTGADNIIRTIAIQTDGKIIIGGSFTTYNGIASNRLARLNADGSLDNTFAIGSGVNNAVFKSFIQLNGKIIIVGLFNSYNGTGRIRIARLNADGSLDNTFNPGLGPNNNMHTTFAQPDGKIIIGGNFTSYNGTSRNRIARVNADGSLDATFDPGTGVNSIVHTIFLQPDGKIIIGGDFTEYNGTVRNRIARLNADGSLDATFTHSANAGVSEIAMQPDGRIIIVGSFTNFNGNTRQRIARVNADGSLDATISSGTNNAISGVALQPDGKIIIGGQFINFGGTARNRVARILGDTPPEWSGTSSTNWNEPTNWNTGVLPTATDSVIIPDVSSASNNFPVLNTNTTIKSLTILENAKITINSSQSLTLTHHIVNEDSLILKESGTVEVGGTFNNLGKIVLEGTGSTPSSLEVSGAFTNSGNIAIGYLQGFYIIQGKLMAAGPFTNTSTGVVNIWGSLETNAALTNEGTIYIEATGGLTQGIASTLSNTSTMTCNIEVAQYAGGSFASPMNNYSVNAIPELSPSGTNGAQIIPVQSPSSFRCNADSVAANSPYGNILELREDAPLLDNCGQSLWHVIASGSFENARGYVFTQVPTFGSRAELTFTGTVNNGAVSYSGLGRQNIPDIDQWDGLATSTSGWHLVSNPYPGPITLSAATLTAMGFDAQIHFIGNGNFISVNPLATTTIAKGQAFQIRKTSVGGSASFTLDNNNRTVNLLALPQYRQQQPQQQYVNITLANAQYENTAMVYFEEEATSAFDSKYDANRLFGAKHVPLIYTTEANGERLSYNALPLLEVGNTQSVPVGVYDGATAGEFTLSFDGINTLNATVMLEDLKLNTMHPITEGNTYTFTTEAGDSRDRFLLHFSADIATGIANTTMQGVRLFPNPTTGETNLILNENHGFSKAVIIDISGRTVQTYELNNTNTKEVLNTAKLNNSIYFIQLTGSSENQTL